MTSEPSRVHVLYHGLPLCRFSELVPGEWPEGHRWISITEHQFATCQTCIETAQKLATALKGGPIG